VSTPDLIFTVMPLMSLVMEPACSLPEKNLSMLRSLAEFVVAFYIAPVFRIERLILHVLAGSPSNVGLGHKWDLSTEQVTPERAGAQRRFRLPSSPEGSPASVARTQNGGGDDQQSSRGLCAGHLTILTTMSI